MYPQPSPAPAADSTILIYGAPGTQIDFALGADQFVAQDCTVYGDDNSLVGVEFCLAASQIKEGSILAGVYACPNGTRDGKCLTSQPGPVPNVSTTMTVYNRQATTVCGARNNSILSVYDLGDPQLDEGVNITALRLAVGWLLNYTAAGLPAESSLNFWFCLLAFILWEFCTNNNENPALSAEQTGGQPNLPAAFQTTASLSEPYTRFVLNRAAFITYLSLEAFALAFCWAMFIWQCVQGKHLPEISSYPQVDFANAVQLHARENMEDRVPAVISGADNVADLPKQMRPDGHDQLPAQSGSSDASAFDSEAHRGPDTSASRPMAAAADTGTAGTVEPEPDLSDSNNRAVGAFGIRTVAEIRQEAKWQRESAKE
ncbi:hypothetical protein B0A55_03897 [Friedmanniomyces simplex]|uniref:Uncharacterized protein n=1 Tax=Friedmanniomyces simplex TaxID=329884 RepID=A0A4U0XRD5_9PEZI|nr:hypothetical protein B0A55_03897 [Friedmanniomyces simplex]